MATTTHDIIDLREVADEWQDTLDTEPRADHRALSEPYCYLCEEIGCDTDPDSLARWANNYEPTLIHEDYFVKYAEELADDIGAIDREARWPLNHIDWQAAADELLVDYTAVTYDGATYYMRSC